MAPRQISLVDVAAIQARLAGRERSQAVIAFMQIFIGLALSFVGPVIMTGFVWFTFLLWGSWLSIWAVFWIAVAVMIPLEYWTEYRTRGSFLAGSVGDTPLDGSPVTFLAAVILAEFSVSNSTTALAMTNSASPAGLVELMLWGPRQLLSGGAKARVGRKFAIIDRGRAATLLQTLLSKTRGEPVKNLQRKGDETSELLLTLAYLAYYDWAGVSEAGDRAWALTEARREFGVG